MKKVLLVNLFTCIYNFVALLVQHDTNIVSFASKNAGYDNVNKFIDTTLITFVNAVYLRSFNMSTVI